jgi:hypothetical protein
MQERGRGAPFLFVVMKTGLFILFWLTTLAATLALPQQTTTTHKAVPKKAKSGKTTKKGPAVTWRNRQLAPTPDRYREIQQALVAKGYLKQEPTGVWDSDSTEALKQFQTDQNLPPTGKINSASLIGLGLGPKIPDQPSPPPPATPAQNP